MIPPGMFKIVYMDGRIETIQVRVIINHMGQILYLIADNERIINWGNVRHMTAVPPNPEGD